MHDDDGTKDDFDRTLGRTLRREAPTADFPREAIEGRIAETLAAGRTAPGWGGGHGHGPGGWVHSLRPALTAAAALLLFVGGMEYGRRTGGERVAAPAPVPLVPADGATLQPLSLPLSIQSTGSRYVADLARLSGEAGLPEEQRRMAREVALAVLYGAALEILAASEEDPALRDAAELIAVTRAGLEVGGPGGRGGGRR